MKKTDYHGGFRLQAGVSGAIIAVLCIAAACLPWQGSVRSANAAIPRVKLEAATRSGMNPATARRAPTKGMPPQPAPSAVLTQLFIPVVEKAARPPVYQAWLPALVKTVNPNLEASFKEKTILVDLSDQHVYAYDKDRLIFNFAASTGRKNLTRPGHYRILDKIPNAYSDPWGFWMPNWMGIYYAGRNLENGFHSLPVLSNGGRLWGDKIGTPVTYGCVVLMPNDMKKLYRWAGVGTAVVIQK